MTSEQKRFIELSKGKNFVLNGGRKHAVPSSDAFKPKLLDMIAIEYLMDKYKVSTIPEVFVCLEFDGVAFSVGYAANFAANKIINGSIDMLDLDRLFSSNSRYLSSLRSICINTSTFSCYNEAISVGMRV